MEKYRKKNLFFYIFCPISFINCCKKKNKNDNIKYLTKTINKALYSITKSDLINYFKNSLKI